MCRGKEKSMHNLDGLTGKHKEMELLERQRCGWNDNIKIDCKYIELEEVEWIDVIRTRTSNGLVTETRILHGF